MDKNEIKWNEMKNWIHGRVNKKNEMKKGVQPKGWERREFNKMRWEGEREEKRRRKYRIN